MTVFKTYDMHSGTKILLETCRRDLSDSVDTNFTSMRLRISELHVIELLKVPRDTYDPPRSQR